MDAAIPLTTFVGGGAILISILFFLKPKGLGFIKDLFNKKQSGLKQQIKDLEVKHEAKVIEVHEAEKKAEVSKKKVKDIVEKAKVEIKATGNISDPEKLIEEFDDW